MAEGFSDVHGDQVEFTHEGSQVEGRMIADEDAVPGPVCSVTSKRVMCVRVLVPTALRNDLKVVTRMMLAAVM